MVIGSDKIFHWDSTENTQATENCRMMSFMIYTPHQALIDHQMKEGDKGRACDMLGWGRMHTGFRWDEVKEGHSEYLDKDEKII